MSKAYFLLMVDDFDPVKGDITSIAEDLELSTHFHCQDYVYFDDEDQLTPYIAY